MLDKGTGLTRLGARDYDPNLGCFITVDPLLDTSNPGQFNAYGYGDANPLAFPDPAGTMPMRMKMGAGGAPVSISWQHIGRHGVQRWGAVTRGHHTIAVITPDGLEAPTPVSHRSAARHIPRLNVDPYLCARLSRCGQPVPSAANVHISSAGGHALLDALGMIPALGIFADGANCIWYGTSGDAGNASMSCAAAIPVYGEWVGGAKIAGKVIKAAHDAETAEGAAKAAKAASVAKEARALLGNPGDVVVLGRQADTAVARSWEGHVVLNTPNWSMELNDEFIRGAIEQRRTIYIASPEAGNLIQKSGDYAGQPTIFARELTMLSEAGYRRVGNYLEPPG